MNDSHRVEGRDGFFYFNRMVRRGAGIPNEVFNRIGGNRPSVSNYANKLSKMFRFCAGHSTDTTEDEGKDEGKDVR